MRFVNIAENNELVNGDTIFHGIANNLSPIIAAFISSIIVGLGALIAWKTYKNTRESTPPELLKLDKWTDSTKKIIELEEKSGNRLLSSATMKDLKESIDIYAQRALWESSLIKSGAPKGIQRRLSNRYPSENPGKSVGEIVPGKLMHILNSIIVFSLWFSGSLIVSIAFGTFILLLFLKLTDQNISIEHNQNAQVMYNILSHPNGNPSFFRIITLLLIIKIIPHVYIYTFMKSYILSQIYYAYSRYSSPTYADKYAVLSTRLNRFKLWGRLSVRFTDADSAPVISSKYAKRSNALYWVYWVQILFTILAAFIDTPDGNNVMYIIYGILFIIMLFTTFVSVLLEIVLFIWPDINILTWEELHIFGLGQIFPAEKFVYNVIGTDLEICAPNEKDVNDVVYVSYPLKYATIKKISRKGEVRFRKKKHFCKFEFNPQDMSVTVDLKCYLR
jgi:membrane protein